MLRSVLEETCSRIIYFCNKQFLKQGICIHSPILKYGIHDNLLLNNNLLSLYAKCYGVEQVRQLFDEMPHRDVVSWTGVLSAYVRNGDHQEALRFFDLMKISGEKPNEYTYSNVLKSCCVLEDLGYGTKVQACVIKHGFEENPILCSSLIELYSKWDLLEEAVGVFNGMMSRDTISWTTMISSFVEAGKWIDAVRCFTQMIEKRVCPNEYTFAKLLDACGFLGIDYGKLVHAQLIVWGVQLNLVLKTTLVEMYANCRKMEDAMVVLNQTSEQDVQLWTALITGFTQNSKFHEAINKFKDMRRNFIVPNNYTYAGILNACSSIRALRLGKQIHTNLIMAGLENDTSVGNALLDFYAKCSNGVKDVICVFKRITLPNVVSWTTLIAGLAAHGLKEECFLAFLEMQFVGQQPNSFTLSNILQSCDEIETRKIHGFAIKTMVDNDTIAGTALIDAYTRLQMVDSAFSLVKEMSNRNAITYTILASKLNQIGHHRLTLEIFKHLRDDDIQPDGFIISSFLSASANLGFTRIGKQLHCYSTKSGFGTWISILNSLVNFYGKSQTIHDAQRAFNEISNPDIVSWNGLMHGFMLNGHITTTLSTLEDMRLAGVKPDSITLLIVLFACDEGDLVDMGVEYFHSLRGIYDIKLELSHYKVLVDILGRAGRLEEAWNVMRSMPLDYKASVHKRVLHWCKLHGNVLLGEKVAREGLELDPCDLGFYGLLGSVYDEVGQFDLGDTMRRLMKEEG